MICFVYVKPSISISPVEILANLKKPREIYNVVFFMENFMGNSMVPLVNFFLLGKKSYLVRLVRYFVQNQFFYR